MQDRPSCSYINSHTEQSVYQRNAVCALSLNSLCDFCDIRYIRSQLYDNGLLCSISYRSCNACRTLAGNAPCSAALLYVRAGNVQLYHINIGSVQLFCNSYIIVNYRTCDICDNHSILRSESGQIVIYKLVNTGILKSDGV